MTCQPLYRPSLSFLLPVLLVFLALLLVPALQAQTHSGHSQAAVHQASGPVFHFSGGGVRLSSAASGFGFGSQSNQGYPPCCINAWLPQPPHAPTFNFHHRRRDGFFPNGGFGGYALPLYSAPYYYPAEIVEPVDDSMEESYGPGPTIFDRRASNRRNLAYEQQYDQRLSRLEQQMDESEARQSAPAAPEGPVADQPATVLVFRDGRTVEVRNYAIVGDMLYDFSGGSHRKIALTDLDVSATQKQNDDRGIDFRLPSRPSGF